MRFAEKRRVVAPATVYLLSSLPVEVTYDALVPEAALLPTRLEQALTTLCRTDGLLDLNRDRLPRQRPDLWASAAAARQDLHRCLRVADGGDGRTDGEQDDAGAFGLEPPAKADGEIGLSALIRDLITANRLILAAYRVAGRGGARACDPAGSAMTPAERARRAPPMPTPLPATAPARAIWGDAPASSQPRIFESP